MRAIETDQKDVEDLYQATEEVEDELKNASIGWRGNTITVEFSGAVSVTSNHRLGRQPVGFIITDIDANITVYRDSWDELEITLTSTGAGNITAEVF